MNVLLLTPYLPTPPRFGAHRRIHGLMREIANRHDVSVLAFVDTHAPPGETEESQRATGEYCRKVVTVPNGRVGAPNAHKRALQLRSMAGLHSYEHLVGNLPAMQTALDSVISAEKFDVIQVEFPNVAAYDFSAAKGRPRLCLDEHNIEYDVLRRTAEADVGIVRRVYNAIDWRKLRLEERREWRRFHGSVLTSKRDQELLLKDLPGAKTAVVPNGVDVDGFVPTSSAKPVPDTVLFLGAINYYPNTEGVLFFLKEAWPALKALRPSVKLKIVGPKPPPSISGWPDPSVEVTGYVDDVRPHIASAAAMIVPLRIGGGTRLKVLEAMSFGKAIVSTALGAEGIDIQHDRDILIADDGPALARQLARVLADEGLATRLGAAARKLAVDRYSWRSCADRLSNFYDELVASGA
ncbi:MAG TPA: glycosyltransferase [Polyangiaceae bacterium]|nr:glycosyltransferase [Polyangiaceae bacterium]